MNIDTDHTTELLGDTMTTTEQATAAGSGASATETFRNKTRGDGTVDHARVAAIAGDVLKGLHDVIRRHDVTYAEYDALKAWLIQVGEDGEWPLWLDVFLEHVVVDVTSKERKGSTATIEGPYYVPGAPEFTGEGTLPMRDDEAGTPFLFQGTVTDLDGSPLDGALVDFWQADDAGYYSQFAPGIPEWNLRGRAYTGADGQFKIHTMKPAPYQIPHDGATGSFIEAAGWHAWRPAHLHLKVSAPGKELMTTQLYFDGGEYVDDDIAQAVKTELVLRPEPAADGNGEQVTYDFMLDPAA